MLELFAMYKSYPISNTPSGSQSIYFSVFVYLCFVFFDRENKKELFYSWIQLSVYFYFICVKATNIKPNSDLIMVIVFPTLRNFN